MSPVETPQQAAEERSKLSRALRDSVEEMKKAGLERADLQAEFESIYHAALLKSERSSAEQRKAEASQKAEALNKKLLRAEVIESYFKQRVRAIESDMKLLMTVAAGIRAEWNDTMRGPGEAA